MVSHSSYTNRKFLILVVQVTNVSFEIKVLPLTKKVSIMMLHMKNFPTSKTEVSFLFFNMANLLQIKL